MEPTQTPQPNETPAPAPEQQPAAPVQQPEPQQSQVQQVAAPTEAPQQPTAPTEMVQPAAPEQATTPIEQPAATPAPAPIVTELPVEPAPQTGPQIIASPINQQTVAFGQSPISQSQLQQNSAKSKKMILIGAAVLVALAIGAGAFVFLTKKDTKNSTSNTSSSVQKAAEKVVDAVKPASDVFDKKDGTLDLSSLIDPQKTIDNQDVSAKLNQQINLKNGLSYIVTGVERNWVSTNKYFKPKTGQEYMRVSFVIGNRAQKDTLYITTSQFTIKNTAGGTQEAEYASTDDVSDALLSEDIQPGKQLKRSLIYVIDKGEAITTLETEDKFDSFGVGVEKKTVTIHSKVTLN